MLDANQCNERNRNALEACSLHCNGEHNYAYKHSERRLWQPVTMPILGHLVLDYFYKYAATDIWLCIRFKQINLSVSLIATMLYIFAECRGDNFMYNFLFFYTQKNSCKWSFFYR